MQFSEEKPGLACADHSNDPLQSTEISCEGNFHRKISCSWQSSPQRIKICTLHTTESIWDSPHLLHNDRIPWDAVSEPDTSSGGILIPLPEALSAEEIVPLSQMPALHSQPSTRCLQHLAFKLYSQNTGDFGLVFLKAHEHRALPEPAPNYGGYSRWNDERLIRGPPPFSHDNLPHKRIQQKGNKQHAVCSPSVLVWALHVLQDIWESPPEMFLNGKALVRMWQYREGYQHGKKILVNLIEVSLLYKTLWVSFHVANIKDSWTESSLKLCRTKEDMHEH